MGLIALIAAVVLGGAFGSASADVVSIDENVMTVEIEVELTGSAASVVAHLSFDNEADLTLPLLDRGGGVFGITTELEPKNYLVVFETLGDDPTTSQPVFLADMGADLLPESGPADTAADEEDDGLSDTSSRYLWAAVALGAASLSALAFWVLGARDDEDPEEVLEEADVSGG